MSIFIPLSVVIITQTYKQNITGVRLGLPLSSIFLLEYSLIPEVFLIQAISEEEVLGHRTWDSKGQGLELA